MKCSMIDFIMAKKEAIKKSSWTIFGVLVTVGLLGGGYYTGFSHGQDRVQYPNYSAEVMESTETLDANFNLFWEAWHTLRSRQIEAADINDQDFVYGAIEGLASSFNDPYTTFFPPVEAAQFEENVKGNFGGIGAEIGIRDGILTVISPLEDSPAQKAGLRAGDLVLKVDGKRSDDMDITTAVGNIRGEIGTSVILNVFRESWLQSRDIEVIRGNIVIPTLATAFFDDGKIIQVKLFSFNENASSGFYKHVKGALETGAKGMILDLRNNPGGYLEVAKDLAGWFLPRGTLVVSERFRSGPDSELYANGNEALVDFPVVVLINGGSASASEILAGALRDQRETPLIGTKSFGKGSVQELVSLSDDSSLKITIAKWVLPKGHILTEGIDPDYSVELSDKDIEEQNDVQLDKALEVLHTLISN
ncbi:MAG: S41 family peptidase [Candidatus Harrisonbacteria bacterium CG10_big_fil_rev_8_21_14_0_10_45_28]|uniref:S41 family peptidase n=1 Tax=Candidatus Harrisonbacteria bacterium CG10_big_fil_rev_8_21_14_0_10_45_28 TaxID=1974586 RepID=A0A2H0UQZ5_9BACT|nr:MAG: S41 family peptidase [Candidatus Harrisonbacteria bacterium CG10_big_fil_rev_8_21_14_0_10_45_28]